MSESRTVPQDETRVQVVAIDDDPQILELYRAVVGSLPVEYSGFADPEEGMAAVLRSRPDILLLDLMLPNTSGMTLLAQIVERAPATEVILITGDYSTDSAVEAIQKGAGDYMTKPVSVQKLRQRIERLIAEVRERQRAFRIEGELANASQFEGMVGRSPLMLEVFARVRRVGPHFRTALVTGATGTGKELVARALHQSSPVASGPYVVCNCSALVETLFESELFGHVRGAFTGAHADKMGLVEHANGGTLFLDEIGDMPIATQAKILRFLQNQEVQRVGSPKARKVDVRVVAATNRDLRAMVSDKTFREDLYYRLSMVELRLPRLADRREDLPLLVRHFIGRFAEDYRKPIRGVTRRAQSIISAHQWPGNVRELENALGHACMMTDAEIIDAAHLPEAVLKRGASDAGTEEDFLTLDELQKRHARRVLARVEGNKLRAAEVLGISRATLYRLLSDSKDDEEAARHSAG